MTAQNSINTQKWILIYTKAKQEGIAKKNLENQGFETFLPLIAHKAKTSDIASFEPIFPRYIFTRVNYALDNLASIRSTKGVSHSIKFGGKYAIVLNTTIKLIQSRLDEDNIFYPISSPKSFKTGEELKINQGTFSGMEAIFLSTKSKERVRILLQFLKNQIVVELPKGDLKEKNIIEPFKF